MRLVLLPAALKIVRAWTAVYTWRMQPSQRSARRAEIDSDLWEFQQDVVGRGDLASAVHVLLRLVCGVPDDVAWRIEHDDFRDRLLLRTVALSLTTASVIFFAVWWTVDSSRVRALPTPPVAPTLASVRLFPPPPPPPPPPPRPRAARAERVMPPPPPPAPLP
jgi:hypothetical protein